MHETQTCQDNPSDKVCVSDASEEPSIGTLYKDMENVTQGRKEKKRNDGSALWECISIRETECAPSAEQSNTGTLLTSLAIEAYSPLLHTTHTHTHTHTSQARGQRVKETVMR